VMYGALIKCTISFKLVLINAHNRFPVLAQPFRSAPSFCLEKERERVRGERSRGAKETQGHNCTPLAINLNSAFVLLKKQIERKTC